MYTNEELLGELEQALNTIEFLHGCLTEPNYRYAYPKMTEERIKRWRKIVGPRNYCVHSNIRPDCPSCEESKKKRDLARAVLEKV